MGDSPTTHPSLLVRIRDPRDDQAWGEFVDIYAPLIYGFARKHGLQDADAADLTQDILRTVAGSAGRLDYDPKRGSFRGWLFTVVRHRLSDFLSSRRWHGRGSGDSAAQDLLEAQPAPAEGMEAEWERDYEWQLVLAAAERVRGQVHDSTWQAFWQTAVEGRGIPETAQSLGLSTASVYLARSRVMARLKEQIRQLQGD